MSAVDAVVVAARHLAEPDGEPRVDQFGQPLAETAVNLTGLAPSVVSTSDDPERHTVIDAPPFQKPVLVNLLWFDVDPSLRLGWEVVLGSPTAGTTTG